MSTRPTPVGQRGAATLVSVMVLFFIMALMAAYASRNLLFEQRIASNYYRSGVAVEAADAGVEWTLSMLNAIRIDAACKPDATSATSFRQRYLNIAPDRTITRVNDAYTAGCVRDAQAQWSCQCPNGSFTMPETAAASQMQPGFRVALLPLTGTLARPGVVRIQVESCSHASSECNDLLASADVSVGKARVWSDAALMSALKTPPAAPLVVKGSVDLGSPGLGLHNSDPGSAGLLAQAGGGISGQTDRLDSVPGTPGTEALLPNASYLLDAGNPDRMFKLHFGMLPRQYRQQPAMRVLRCDGDCSTALTEAYGKGIRMIWVDGPLSISSNITLGSATDPVVLVADGALALDGPMLLYGLIYAKGNAQLSNGSGLPAQLSGALLVEGSLSASGGFDLWYRTEMMSRISNQMGSFVRVPDSWWEGN